MTTVEMNHRNRYGDLNVSHPVRRSDRLEDRRASGLPPHHIRRKSSANGPEDGVRELPPGLLARVDQADLPNGLRRREGSHAGGLSRRGQLPHGELRKDGHANARVDDGRQGLERTPVEAHTEATFSGPSSIDATQVENLRAEAVPFAQEPDVLVH